MKPPKTLSFNRALDLMRFDGARLLKMHTNASPEGVAHYVVPGGYVTPETAEKIKKHPLVASSHDGLWPGLEQTWRLWTTNT
jgi:hypothetical protein